MENVQLAVTSNGRTVYEMAHMNIPAIVIPQHKREKTHEFACVENGFVPLDIYRENITEEEVYSVLVSLLDDPRRRYKLFNATCRFKFNKNKKKVGKLISGLLEP